jgi:ATPases of the AAA+ class
MSNIFCLNCGLGDFAPWFKEQILKNIQKLGALSECVQIWIVNSYLAELPNENDAIKFIYFKKFSEKYLKTINEFNAEMKQINERAKLSLGGFGNVKIFVLFNFKDENDAKKAIYGEGQNENKANLDISPIVPKYTFNQMILNEKVKENLLDCVYLIKNMQIIYDEWGFKEIDPIRKSIINFFGPPGTGKTMSAHAIANEINKKILTVNYADVESKFVGEAPKNLISVFEIAKSQDAVLFFDEADSFLGKRITNVGSSSDQSVNSLRSQMLILLESYDITIIFATNLNENYDKAFNSRILTNIKFELPDISLRKQTITKLIPANAPIQKGLLGDDKLISKLANLSDGFSYRDLKNTILASLIKCIKQNSNLTNEILLDIFKNKKTELEALKNDKTKLENKIKSNLSNKNYKTLRKVNNAKTR